MKASEPAVAVLIPHYNNISGLRRSLSSISNIEPVNVVIVDDGSLEKPDLQQLKSTYHDINDFHLILLDQNQGIEHALNEGLKYIYDSGKYKYVARMDCGDTNTPDRFRRQREMLENNDDIYVVSNYANIVDTSGNFLFLYKLPLTHKEISRTVYIKDPIFHASAMFKVKAIDRVGYYPTDYQYCEDTAYFYKFIRNFKAANIGSVLYYCEQNPSGISITKYRKQKWSRIRFSLASFTLRYPLAWVTGLTKNVACFLLGPKISLGIAYKLYREREI